MSILKIDKNGWAEGVAKLHESYALFGPVKERGYHNMKRLESGALPDLSFTNTRLSPKAVVYPQSEKMFEYTIDESKPDHHVNHEAPKDYSPRAILGIRPCDTMAFGLVARNFDNPEYKDPWWIQAREVTTLVGLACDAPRSTCFCTSAGSGPHDTSGQDILLVDKGDYFFAQVLTEKGQTLAQKAGWTAQAGPEAKELLGKAAQEANAKVTSKIETSNLAKKSLLALHGASFWEDVAFACINCGTCTFLCPTCWCFDIQDEVLNKQGIRIRNWDSCMYPLFTLHGSGHNPRGKKVERVRQRFMHKLKYFLDKYQDGIQCVGCGRCIQFCPVNIDIRKVASAMNNFEPAGECAA